MVNFTQELIRENVRKLGMIIKDLTYKPKWSFWLDDGVPTKFVVHIECEDSTGQHNPFFKGMFYDGSGTFTEYDVEPKPFQVRHVFAIPTVDMTIVELERYVLDRIMDVDRHEAMEFFKIQGRAVFMPDHSDVTKLYSIHRR